MNKTEKLLVKLSPTLRSHILEIVARLQAGDEKGLDTKQLKGRKGIYRTRVGNYRIIYARDKSGLRLLRITKRDDRTYRDF